MAICLNQWKIIRLFKESETLRIQKENDLRQLEILKKKYE
jgi:hypothetical protein